MIFITFSLKNLGFQRKPRFPDFVHNEQNQRLLAILICSNFILSFPLFAANLNLDPCVQVAHCSREEWDVNSINEPMNEVKKILELTPRTKITELEDDYIHLETALEEMVSSYERISSQLKKELFICPADYPFLYMDNEKTNLLIGSKRHWRTTSKSLMTFMVSKPFIEKYWDIFLKTCSDLNDPWEKYFNEIYEKEVCISPVQSLTVHITNINSGYGLSPFIDYKKLWDDNNYK